MTTLTLTHISNSIPLTRLAMDQSVSLRDLQFAIDPRYLEKIPKTARKDAKNTWKRYQHTHPFPSPAIMAFINSTLFPLKLVQKIKKYNTTYSRVVTHHSTDVALRSLACKIGRVCAFSSRYGRIWKSSFLSAFKQITFGITHCHHRPWMNGSMILDCLVLGLVLSRSCQWQSLGSSWGVVLSYHSHSFFLQVIPEVHQVIPELQSPSKLTTTKSQILG